MEVPTLVLTMDRSFYVLWQCNPQHIKRSVHHMLSAFARLPSLIEFVSCYAGRCLIIH